MGQIGNQAVLQTELLSSGKCMENLIENVSEKRMERLTNPQMSDHYQTLFFGKYGTRLYEVKVGRKWVTMKSNNHKARLPLHKFRDLAFLEWRKTAMTEASTKGYKETGTYHKAKGWWKAYGFTSNPQDFNYNPSRLAW